MAETLQRITRLMPLADAVARIDALATPVGPRAVAAADAVGLTLAADVMDAARLKAATALVDGWAVNAAAVVDASGYSPIPFARIPPRVETGDEMPPGADAVLPPDAVIVRGAQAEALAPVAPGEGVVPVQNSGGDARRIFTAGHRLRAADIAVLLAEDVVSVSVRIPQVAIATAREDLRLRPAAQFIARDCSVQGGAAIVRNGVDLIEAMTTREADVIVIVGGTGSGARDNSVTTLARVGKVAAHGIGIAPGSTAALGEAGGKLVLIVPGRLDGALSAWLLMGRRLLGRLAGTTSATIASRYRLARKVVSTVGVCEFVPVCFVESQVEPLGGGFLPHAALARADGYIVVPAASEGYAAGSEVAVHDWP